MMRANLSCPASTENLHNHGTAIQLRGMNTVAIAADELLHRDHRLVSNDLGYDQSGYHISKGRRIQGGQLVQKARLRVVKSCVTCDAFDGQC